MVPLEELVERWNSDPEVQKQLKAALKRSEIKRKRELFKEGLIGLGFLAILAGGLYYSVQQAKITLLHEQFYLPRCECLYLQKEAGFNPQEKRDFPGMEGKYSCREVEDIYQK